MHLARELSDPVTLHGNGIVTARYIINAIGSAGPITFHERLTLDSALRKAGELRDAHFEHITLVNVLTGVEIMDLEALIQQQPE